MWISCFQISQRWSYHSCTPCKDECAHSQCFFSSFFSDASFYSAVEICWRLCISLTSCLNDLKGALPHPTTPLLPFGLHLEAACIFQVPFRGNYFISFWVWFPLAGDAYHSLRFDNKPSVLHISSIASYFHYRSSMQQF